MDFRNYVAGAAGAVALFSAGAADAALVFVGSWRLTDGPANPSVLSAQQVAAQLFGGNAADYMISTAGSSVASIDSQAWYEIVGMPGSALIAAQDATDFFGFGLSAYGYDPVLAAEQDRFVNYAFADREPGPGIPEPGVWALMIAGFGLAGAALRRRKAIAA